MAETDDVVNISVSFIRSQDLEAEEGIRRRLLPGERSTDETNSVMAKQLSSVILEKLSDVSNSLTAERMLEKLSTYLLGNDTFSNENIISCVIALLWDPLYFYTLVMNDEKQCINMDFTLASAVILVRFVLDSLFQSRSLIKYQSLGKHLCDVHYHIWCGVVFLFDWKSADERRQKIHELNRWVPFQKIDPKVQDQVKRYRSQEWRNTRGIDVEYLLNNLPDYIGQDLKQQLCLDLLKKVTAFRWWDDAALAYLCNHVRPVFYTERSYIVREREPIDQMLFVLQGKLWTYTSSSRIAGSSSSAAYNNNNRLEDGDFWGEELVDWAVMANHDSSNLPISSTTIQALTNVEAFVLLADDLKTCIMVRQHESSP